ncbi:FG-GAP-like repeat-containing protein [Planctomycetota bacterium]
MKMTEPAGSAPSRSLHAADLDGDGDLDVLTVSDWFDEIVWYANDGTGRFGSPQFITTEGNLADSVYAVDLDGDDDLDVLAVSTSDGIAWYENDGTGQFGTPQIVATETDRADLVYAADLDGDGDLDVFSASSWRYGKIVWYENGGSGQFGPRHVITTSAAGAVFVHAADLDNDSDLDILSASVLDDKIGWYENNGSGQFGIQQGITLSYGIWAFHTADLDNDGDHDVLSAAPYAGVIAWYANDGTGRFGTQQAITASALGAVSVHAADLDNDGDLDVLSAGAMGGWFEFPGSGEIAWYENDGFGQFGSQQVIDTVVDHGLEYVHAADLDGDGDLDVLSVSYEDGITWYENDGTGRFISQQVVTASVSKAALSVYAIYTADLDGDGDLDVLSTLGVDDTIDWRLDDRIIWYENDGTGQFTSPQVITADVNDPQSVYAADLDGDGDLDVLSASYWDGIAWCKNDGTGQFGTLQVIPTEAKRTDLVFAADLDNDGDLDVLSVLQDISGSNIDGLAWYENDGTGQFGSQQVIATEANRWFVFTTDLDGDGNLDVLTIGDDKIAWYENEYNRILVADAGLSRYAATDPIQLDGTNSYDPDESGLLSYTWQQVSGPSVTITDANTATPTISDFIQTDEIQECAFELIVSDGELRSLPDIVKVIIVSDFGDRTFQLENPPFDPNKPTIVYFSGGNAAAGGDVISGLIGNPGRWNNDAWNSRANVISFPSGYYPDGRHYEPWATYYSYGDLLIVYLSNVAPNYQQPIQVLGFSLGGNPTLDLGIRLNSYSDARYAVHHVTAIDAATRAQPQFGGSWDMFGQTVELFLNSSVDGEPCWLDFYYGTVGWPYEPFPRTEFLRVRSGHGHSPVRDWYRDSITSSDMNTFNGGVVAGAYWSVVGPGKNLYLARSDAYYFNWDGGVQSGSMNFYDETQFPGRLPEPVTLIGPEDGSFVDANGAILSCETSENSIGYQLLFGQDPYHMVYLFSDTHTPPNEQITSFPFEKTWWTVKAYDQYGSTIYADPNSIIAENVIPQPIENITTTRQYSSIQQAINDALDGQEIVISPGIYQYLENINFKGKKLTVRSTDPNDPNVVAATVIKGVDHRPVVSLSCGQGADSEIAGLTITGEKVGFSCCDATPTIQNCTIISNGPIAVEFWDGYEPTIINCNIQGQIIQVDDPRLIVNW